MHLEEILGLDNKLVMKFKQVFILLKMNFKLTLKIIYLARKERKKYIFEWGWTENISHYESYVKTDHKNEHNIREYDISG